jgi:eukaryotic-like serine/threonine-protein kinase
MAPELLRGNQADARSDIFGFGCVLYEMITGKRPFSGSSQLSVISAILERQPEPLTTLQPMTSRLVEHVVLRCLAKDPDERWQTVRDLRRELMWAAEASEITKEVRPAARRLRWIPWGVAAALLPLLAWLGFARWIKPPSPQRQSFRLSIEPPPSTSFVPYSLAISPDGRRVAFVAAGLDGATALWIRNLASGSFQQISGTENALYPFWSADSREIGFSSGAKLKRADPSTGAVQVISNVGAPFGDAWNDHGIILFVGTGGLLYKVDASGDAPQPVTRATGNEAYRWPSFLPDQDHFLYFVDNPEHSGRSTALNGIYVGSLTTMESKKISSEIINAVQFASGRLFFVRDRSLMAQPFDLQRLELTGKAEVIAPEEIDVDPAYSNLGFSVSSNGVVVFQSAADNFSQLSWFDRQGKDLESVSSPGYRDPSLSGMAVFLPLPRMTSTTEGILSESMTSLAVPVRWFPTAGPTRFRLYPTTARP